MARSRNLRNFAAEKLLEELPPTPDEVAVWLGGLKASDFDAVCSSAIVMTLADTDQDGNSFLSVRNVAVMVNAMRDRYRKVLKMPMTVYRDKKPVVRRSSPQAVIHRIGATRKTA